MAIQNATAVTLSIGGVLMAHATSASLSVSRDLRDSTTKSSLGWSESLSGLKSWEMSGDAFVDISETTTGLAACFDLLDGGAEVTVVFAVDSINYTGQALITSVSADAGVEENTSFSVSFTGTAGLVKA
jgi:predicted secreted protein